MTLPNKFYDRTLMTLFPLLPFQVDSLSLGVRFDR